MPQVTPTDFRIKHDNNNTPPMKDAERAENYSIEGYYLFLPSSFFTVTFLIY